MFSHVYAANPPIARMRDTMATIALDTLREELQYLGCDCTIDQSPRSIAEIASAIPDLVGVIVLILIIDGMNGLSNDERAEFSGYLRAARLNSFLLALREYSRSRNQDWTTFVSSLAWFDKCVVVVADRKPTEKEREIFHPWIMSGPSGVAKTIGSLTVNRQDRRPKVLLHRLNADNVEDAEFNAFRKDASLFAVSEEHTRSHRRLPRLIQMRLWKEERPELEAVLVVAKNLGDLCERFHRWQNDRRAGEGLRPGLAYLVAIRLASPHIPSIADVRAELSAALAEELDVFQLAPSDPAYDRGAGYFVVRRRDVPVIDPAAALARLSRKA